MNYSLAVFLINPKARAVAVTFDSDYGNGKKYTFKTMDPDIKVGDFVVVPSNFANSYGRTIAKVVAVDLDVDHDSKLEYKWIVDRIKNDEYEDLLKVEEDAVKKIRAAITREKQKNLAKTLLDDAVAGGLRVSTLKLTKIGHKK